MTIIILSGIAYGIAQLRRIFQNSTRPEAIAISSIHAKEQSCQAKLM